MGGPALAVLRLAVAMRLQQLLPFAESAGDFPSLRELPLPSQARKPATAGSKLSLVIPATFDCQRPAAVTTVADSASLPERLEVVIARGSRPSAQRNAAVCKARGDYILFLDDDSQPAPELFQTYLSLLEADADIAAADGPAVPTSRSLFQSVSALVLGEPLVMGKSASRYRSRGVIRPTDERELILCNLAVRREVFQSAGGFNENLYPNEENELLDRLAKQGAKLVYHPEAIVRRAQWESPGLLLCKVFQYGKGRSAQARRSLSRFTAVRLCLSLLLISLLTGTLSAWIATGLGGFLVLPGLYAAYMALVSLKLLLRGGVSAAILGPPVAALVHLGYAAGVAVGLFVVKGPKQTEILVEKKFFQKGFGP